MPANRTGGGCLPLKHDIGNFHIVTFLQHNSRCPSLSRSCGVREESRGRFKGPPGGGVEGAVAQAGRVANGGGGAVGPHDAQIAAALEGQHVGLATGRAGVAHQVGARRQAQLGAARAGRGLGALIKEVGGALKGPLVVGTAVAHGPKIAAQVFAQHGLGLRPAGYQQAK